ncbi:MAG: helix-turn-helix domain-containing protein [Solirubrobacteraceae bacterium]
MDDRAQFAANLRSQRTKRGLSQMALGEAAGLHFSEISLLERGGRDPRLTTIAKLARGLGIPPRRLLDGIE